VSLATILSIVVAYQSFKETLEFQRETYAIQFYASYADLCDRRPEFEKNSVTSDSTKWDELYEAHAHRVLFTCESIINIRGGSQEWDNTVTYMLTPHLKYYKKSNAVTNAFSERFRGFYNQVITNTKNKN
jgi:hypothetical protein